MSPNHSMSKGICLGLSLLASKEEMQLLLTFVGPIIGSCTARLKRHEHRRAHIVSTGLHSSEEQTDPYSYGRQTKSLAISS